MAAIPEIASEIEALAVHCRMPVMEVGQRASWLRDWCEDLREFEIDHIRAAFREWRHSGQVKFPTAGQILPTLRKKLDAARPQGRVDEWRPLSDADYEALSLDGKIRHHLILQGKALNEAGPQMKDKMHVPAEQMPAKWREGRRRAANHAAEAKRLRELMKVVRKDMTA